VGRAEVDQINIIARWIHHHSDEDTRNFFRLPRDLADADAAHAFAVDAACTIAAELTALLAAPDSGDADEMDVTMLAAMLPSEDE
jgi:hypothetical protein